MNELPPVFVCKGTLARPPISINDAYTTFRGTMHLKKAGEAFKDELALAVSRSSMNWKLAHDCVYQHGGWVELTVTIYFANLYNKSWTPTNKVKTKYKKKDVSNYIKLIEDGIEKGSGLNDCNNTDVTLRKRHDPDNPRIEFVLSTHIDDEEIYILLMDGDE